MNDTERIRQLETELAELQARVNLNDDGNHELVCAVDRIVPALAESRQQWEKLFTKTIDNLKAAPELERLREQGLLPKFQALATRQRVLEEGFVELRALIVETYSMLIDFIGR
jgi:hypothetical protein